MFKHFFSVELLKHYFRSHQSPVTFKSYKSLKSIKNTFRTSFIVVLRDVNDLIIIYISQFIYNME